MDAGDRRSLSEVKESSAPWLEFQRHLISRQELFTKTHTVIDQRLYKRIGTPARSCVNQVELQAQNTRNKKRTKKQRHSDLATDITFHSEDTAKGSEQIRMISCHA